MVAPFRSNPTLMPFATLVSAQAKLCNPPEPTSTHPPIVLGGEISPHVYGYNFFQISKKLPNLYISIQFLKKVCVTCQIRQYTSDCRSTVQFDYELTTIWALCFSGKVSQRWKSVVSQRYRYSPRRRSGAGRSSAPPAMPRQAWCDEFRFTGECGACRPCRGRQSTRDSRERKA